MTEQEHILWALTFADRPPSGMPADQITAMTVLARAYRDSVHRQHQLAGALQFYASERHLMFDDPGSWDNIQGEPGGWLRDDADTTSVENGWVAQQALRGDDPFVYPKSAPGGSPATTEGENHVKA